MRSEPLLQENMGAYLCRERGGQKGRADSHFLRTVSTSPLSYRPLQLCIRGATMAEYDTMVRFFRISATGWLRLLHKLTIPCIFQSKLRSSLQTKPNLSLLLREVSGSRRTRAGLDSLRCRSSSQRSTKTVT